MSVTDIESVIFNRYLQNIKSENTPRGANEGSGVPSY
jgi:hypothetical protein